MGIKLVGLEIEILDWGVAGAFPGNELNRFEDSLWM